MLSFDEIIGHATPIELLRRMLSSGHVPHGFLFRGPQGVGKAAVARALAASLLCETPSPAACGSCGSCGRFLQGAHPDLVLIRRLPKPTLSKAAAAAAEIKEGDLRSEIVIDQIRELSQLAGLAPREGRHRVFIIDPADRMNRNAQNALLKTLEEPPERAVLILIAARAHLLLPTVRSRSFDVGFAPLRAAELARVLEESGMPAEEAAQRAALAQGRPSRAVDLDLPSLRERREDLLQMLEALADGTAALGQLPVMAARFAGKDEATLLGGLDLLQGLLRDAGRSDQASPPETLIHADLSARLAQLGRRLSAERTAELVRSCQRAHGFLRFNTNRVLIAESLLAAVAGGPMP